MEIFSTFPAVEVGSRFVPQLESTPSESLSAKGFNAETCLHPPIAAEMGTVESVLSVKEFLELFYTSVNFAKAERSLQLNSEMKYVKSYKILGAWLETFGHLQTPKSVIAKTKSLDT